MTWPYRTRRISQRPQREKRRDVFKEVRFPRSSYGSRTERYRFVTYQADSFTTVPGGVTTWSTNEYPEVISGTHSREGTSLPNWKDKIKRGEDATTDFDGSKQFVKVGYGDVWNEAWNNLAKNQINRYTTKGFRFLPENWGDMSPMWIPSELKTDADALALQYLYKRIREEQTQMQGMVFLGELRETLRMLKSPAKALRAGIDDYLNTLSLRAKGISRGPTRKRKKETQKSFEKRKKSFDQARAKKLNKVLADTWLEYSFGWKPLIHDIEDALKAYSRLTETDRWSTFTATATKEHEHAISYYQSAWGQVPIDGFRRKVNGYSRRYRVTLKFKPSTDYSPGERKRELFGIQFKEFVPTLWEVLPWSFLFDYFANIGEVLEASVTNTGDFVWGVRTDRDYTSVFRTEYVNSERIRLQDPLLYRGSGGTLGKQEQTWRRVWRRRITSIPFPSLRVDLPGKPQQWLNMAALAVSKRKFIPFK